MKRLTYKEAQKIVPVWHNAIDLLKLMSNENNREKAAARFLYEKYFNKRIVSIYI